MLDYRSVGFFHSGLWGCKFYQPPTCIPQLRQIIHERRCSHRSSLADVNADGLPHGFEVARSCVGKCLSAHRAMWQPQARILELNGKRKLKISGTKHQGFKFVVSNVNSIDSPNMFLICLCVFPKGTKKKPVAQAFPLKFFVATKKTNLSKFFCIFLSILTKKGISLIFLINHWFPFIRPY